MRTTPRPRACAAASAPGRRDCRAASQMALPSTPVKPAPRSRMSNGAEAAVVLTSRLAPAGADPAVALFACATATGSAGLVLLPADGEQIARTASTTTTAHRRAGSRGRRPSIDVEVCAAPGEPGRQTPRTPD